MNKTADTVVRHFFDETGMDQVPLDLLQQFVEDYPYVAAAHLLLAKKLYDRHEVGAEDYANAVNIYLHNPLLLDHILNPITDNGSGHFELRANQLEGAVSDQENHHAETAFDIPENELTETERSYFGYAPLEKEASRETSTPDEIVSEQAIAETSSEYQEESLAEFSPEPVSEHHESATDTNEKAEAPDSESNAVTYAFAPENYGVNAGHQVEQDEFEISQAQENAPESETQEEAFDPQFHEVPVGEEPSAEAAEVVDIPSSSFDQNEKADQNLDEETSEQIETAADEEASIPGSSEQVFEFNDTFEAFKSKEGAVEEIKLEPYYTVDYFASQGIRLQMADLGKDSIGKQLRSFTDWLKSMKRLPYPSDSPADEAVQQSIVRIAAHSIEEKEVITETMAEVWAKQGNVQRAMDIYNKLSLQNPSKSHYFAAKIEQLKSI